MESENDIIRDRAKFLAKGSKPSELPGIVILVMYDLRLPLGGRGFTYLKEVFPVACREPAEIVLKDIFNEVGGRHNPVIGYDQMYDAIHVAVVAAWNSGHRDKWKYYFPSHVIEGEEAPTNLEFISAIVYFLEMWRNGCKEGDYARQ